LKRSILEYIVPQRDLDKEDYWRGIIAKFLATDLPSKAAFCRAEGIRDKHLTNWQRVIKQRDKQRKLDQQRLLREPRREAAAPAKRSAHKPTNLQAAKPQDSREMFVPLSVVNEKTRDGKPYSAVAEIRSGAIVVSIFAGADADSLRALLSALKEY
jgi:hypothetical protein